MKLLSLIASAALILAPAAYAGDSVHDYQVKDIQGKDVNLADYKDKVLMIVNVASKCGATPQYADLVALQEKYADQGLVVLGFPANNFGGQEPGSNEEIMEFCKATYEVDFPMFAKVSVKGDDKAPLFEYLTSAENPDKEGDIVWNFEKFLVGKDGKLLRRFKTGINPGDSDVSEAVEKALK